jgi:methyl-accepting chemotaxis protein
MRIPRTIKARLLGLTVLAVVLAVALGATGYLAVLGLDHSVEQDVRTIEALRNQGELDGANHAIQFDLLQLATTQGDPQEVQADLAERLDTLRTVPSANRRLLVGTASPALRKAFDALDPTAVAFADATEAAAEAAKADDPAMSDLVSKANAAEVTFDEQFDAVTEAIDASTAAHRTDARHGASRDRLVTLLMTLLALLVLPAGILIARSILRPLARLGQHLAEIADGDGDLTRRLPDDGRDELAVVSAAFNRFVAKLQGAMQRIAGTAELLGGSSTTLTATSASMADSAEATSDQLGAASGAAALVSTSVEAVASAMDEIGQSIREVATNATAAARVAGTAVGLAADADATVARLGAASHEIGEVVDVINAIAEQTNLLALNATIEAARAGDAGKGFAVVANEVKDLAKETAKATGRITERIASVQAESNAAVTAIREIGRVIGEIDASQTSIAAAVEQQTASTAEIERRVGEASDGTGSIARTMTAAADAATGTSRGATDTADAASDLSRMASELGELVGHFRY